MIILWSTLCFFTITLNYKSGSFFIQPQSQSSTSTLKTWKQTRKHSIASRWVHRNFQYSILVGGTNGKISATLDGVTPGIYSNDFWFLWVITVSMVRQDQEQELALKRATPKSFSWFVEYFFHLLVFSFFGCWLLP